MAENDIWTTKEGIKMKMMEITNNHLKNAINFFEPKKTSYKKRWKLLMAEKKRRDNLIPDNTIESRFDILDL